MPKVFLVEDDLALSQLIVDKLTKYGYLVDKVTDFRNVEKQFELSAPDIVLLDINLPYLDGFYFVRHIRRISNTPIIIISARNSSSEQVMGIEFGADDYITKPFELELLIAKLGALLRRSNIAVSSTILKAGELELDTEKFTLRRLDNSVLLTKNEYKIMKKLLNTPGKIVMREELFEELWDDTTFVEENTLSVNMTRLKSRLEELGINDAIKVKRGTGYYIEIEALTRKKEGIDL